MSLENEVTFDVGGNELRPARRGRPFVPSMAQIRDRALEGCVRPPRVVVDGEVAQQVVQVIQTLDDGHAFEPLMIQRADDASLRLARDGKSEYRIAVAQTAAPAEKRAAAELQRCIEEISAVRVPIVTDDQPLSGQEIVLGDNRHLRKLRTSIDFQRLGDEGFVLRTVGKHLVIAGGPVCGTLYGVYTFLENYLGCRWYSSKVSHIPRCSEIVIGPIDDTQVPVVKFREVYYLDAMDQDFAARNKLNGNDSVIQNGGRFRDRHRDWGLWCHTFGAHVPPKKYFTDHPEYFAMVDGERVPDTQLCLTNPEVFEIVVADLQRRMQEDPDAHYWSVSQNDTGGNCQCLNCRAIDEREETPMGSLLEFINRIAAKFPDKTISTLAYQYTRRPPKTLRPARNVLIMLCSIECDRSRPIANDLSTGSFREDLESWSKICDNVFIWDYVVNFSDLVSPFPNLRVLQPDIKFFIANSTKGVFSQGNREVGGEFAELRAYVLAKLLWNPNCDADQLIDDFLCGYYGTSAKPIREYIDLMHEALEQSGVRLDIFGGRFGSTGSLDDHRNGYLSPELVAQYDAFFDEAERLVANDKEVLLRVQTARMPLMNVQLQLGYGDVDTRRTIAQKLFSNAERTGLLMFAEHTKGTARYRTEVMEALEREKEARH